MEEDAKANTTDTPADSQQAAQTAPDNAQAAAPSTEAAQTTGETAARPTGSDPNNIAEELGQEFHQVSETAQYAIQFLIDNAAKIGSAALILAIGYYFSGWLKGFLLKRFENRNLDPTLSRFFAGSARVIILIIVITFAVAKFYDIAPLVAGIGAIAFGASLAIQGPISNFGSGIAIILTRPFVVDDTILVQGQFGQVKEVTLGFTQLITEDGEVITIPNKLILGEIFTNSHANRIVEQTISIPATADAEKALQVLKDAVLSVEGVVTDPLPTIGIEEFGLGYTVLGYRYWIPTAHYQQIRFKVNNTIDAAFRTAGIPPAIPAYNVNVDK